MTMFVEVMLCSCLLHFVPSNFGLSKSWSGCSKWRKNMKSNCYKVARRMMVAVLSLVLLSCILVPGATADTSPSLTKKELKALLARAKTPADHARLAAYYRDKAQHLRQQEQEYSAEASSLATQPAAVEGKCTRSFLSKQGTSCNSASHYSYFAKECAKKAKDAEILAAQQQQLSESDQVAAPQN
jgi:hypothetical protein